MGRSEDRSVAVSFVVVCDRRVSVLATPPGGVHVTCAVLLKPVPFTVSVMSALPSAAVAGLILVGAAKAELVPRSSMATRTTTENANM